jgi:hypothetical protein
MYHFKILLSPPFEHNEIPNEKYSILLSFEIGGGAVLLLWARSLLPLFGINRQKRSH